MSSIKFMTGINKKNNLTSLLFLSLFLLAALPVLAGTETINYTYDDMSRLIRAQYGDGTVINYIYDMSGNRLVKSTTLAGAPVNHPPNAIIYISPANEATGVETSPTLNWTGGNDPDSGDIVTYYLYFGTSPNPPLISTGPMTSFLPGPLDLQTTYYWKVVSKDNHNTETSGPVWRFTTKSPPAVSFNYTVPANSTSTIVSFTDTSTAVGDEIVSWAWDFNHDGIVDSTLKNPNYIFPSRGKFTVSLTVTDAHGAASTVRKPLYLIWMETVFLMI